MIVLWRTRHTKISLADPEVIDDKSELFIGTCL